MTRFASAIWIDFDPQRAAGIESMAVNVQVKDGNGHVLETQRIYITPDQNPSSYPELASIRNWALELVGGLERTSK